MLILVWEANLVFGIIITYKNNSNWLMEVEETWVMPREPVWAHKNQQFVKGVIKEVYKDIITVML